MNGNNYIQNIVDAMRRRDELTQPDRSNVTHAKRAAGRHSLRSMAGALAPTFCSGTFPLSVEREHRAVLGKLMTRTGTINGRSRRLSIANFVSAPAQAAR